MSTEIENTDLRAKDLYSVQDKIFDDQALANSGATASGVFMLAQTMGSTQLKIVAGAGGCATGAGETLVIKVETSPTLGGTFDNMVFTKTIPASTTFAAGTDIASFVPPREVDEIYTKITITSNFDATGQSVTAYQVGVART